MNVELADKLYRLLENKQLDEAISMAEQALKEIPSTDFHKILNRNLLHLTSDLAKHINEFDKSTKEVLRKKSGYLNQLFGLGKEARPAAYYCEMNGFTINYNRWYIDLFSFENYRLTDWEWLSDFYDSTANDLTISGFEEIQRVYQDIHENNRFKEPNILDAYQVCELLVILRLQELFRETYKLNQGDWNKVPMFITAHDYDLIFKVN